MSNPAPVAVLCPSCRQALRVRGYKPGRHEPRCPHCQATFRLDLPEDHSEPPRVEGEPGPSVALPGEEVPETLAGYRIERKLGQGGMGAVYLARQLSLNRLVALKVLSREWVTDPRFLVRFIREAHTAARLSHHNIVQIFDIGSDAGYHFFSMEYVQGHSLSDLIRKGGRLDVVTAVDYTLQAARGLQYAHTHGLVHRDIKPDNLLVNEHGLVKVADLGLVKTEAAEEPGDSDSDGSESPSVTRLGTGMGTPTYIAPEQARNAALVDGRADIYSLGCTLYVMLTGRPPFEGETAMEVMLKHLKEPPRIPDGLKPAIPAELWSILTRMLAKQPEKRFPDMAAVVTALERFQQPNLSVRKSTGPEEGDVATLGRLVREFNDDQLAQARPWAVTAWLVGCAVLLIPCALAGWGKVGFGILLMAPLTLLFRALITSFVQRTALVSHLRSFFQTRSFRFWLVVGGAVLGLLLVLALLGLAVPFVAAMLMALVFGGCFAFFYDRTLAEQRKGTLAKTERLLQRLRLRGVSEEEVRRFVCEFGGERWEEFYETLFGYEALSWARAQQIPGASGKPREHRAGLRDQLYAWLKRQSSQGTSLPVAVPVPSGYEGGAGDSLV